MRASTVGVARGRCRLESPPGLLALRPAAAFFGGHMARYECDRCGACCKQLIVEIDELDLVREPRLIPLAQAFRVPDGMELRADDGGSQRPCPVLGPDNRCTIYPTRPNCCVAFRAGSEQCQMARGMAGLPPLEESP